MIQKFSRYSTTYSTTTPSITKVHYHPHHHPASHKFQFYRVWQPDVSQAEVFDEIRPLVSNALDGYNCTVLAYGQTGSGKTWTMSGMYERAFRQVFLEVQANVALSISVVEIYNDVVYDLLHPQYSNGNVYVF